MSTHNYIRTPISDGFDLGGRDFGDTVRTALPGKVIRIRCDGTDCEIEATPDLTAGEVTTLDSTVAAFQPLKRLRRRRYAEIEAKTIRLLTNKGFEFPASSGRFFSLSPQGQRQLFAIHTASGTPALTFPYNVSTTNNRAIALADATAATQFHRRGMTRLLDVMQGGTDLKEQVRIAADEAAILAVVDSRT